jgi:hypothetical protein
MRQYWEKLEAWPRAQDQTPCRTEVDGHRQRLDRLLSGHPEGEPPIPAIPGAIAVCLTATCFSGPWGTSCARNLTPDSATGIGTWTAAYCIKVLRTGIRGDGEPLRP